MSDESQVDAVAVEPVPEQEETAPLESVENEAPEQEQEPKTFTQEEVDALVAKRLAKSERHLRRELQQQAAAEQPRYQPSSEPPKPDQFQSANDYVDALADWKAEQKIAEREFKQQQTKVESSYADREETARDKYHDFQDVVYLSPSEGGPAISEFMAAAIKDSEMGPEIAYHLGKNVAESKRIYALNPLAQAREIGRIEAKLSANPAPVKKVSSAPEPIKPVTPRSTTVSVSTSDPRSTKEYGDSEWIAKRNRELAKRMSR